MRGLILCRSTAINGQLAIGCGKWNVYIGTGRPLKIDTTLRCCGRRVKFQAKRKSARGRPRPVHFLERPEHMPVHALIQECRERNNMMARAEEFGFVKASEL